MLQVGRNVPSEVDRARLHLSTCGVLGWVEKGDGWGILGFLSFGLYRPYLKRDANLEGIATQCKMRTPKFTREDWRADC